MKILKCDRLTGTEKIPNDGNNLHDQQFVNQTSCGRVYVGNYILMQNKQSYFTVTFNSLT